jgi:hypothetical protein
VYTTRKKNELVMNKMQLKFIIKLVFYGAKSDFHFDDVAKYQYSSGYFSGFLGAKIEKPKMETGKPEGGR